MNETTGPSPRDSRLLRIQELIEQGKRRRATDELWMAEAEVRGNRDAIRELIDFTVALEQRTEPKQKAELVELLAALEHDAKNASAPAPEPAAPAEPCSRPPGQLALSVLSIIVATVVGVALLFASTSDFMCSTVTRSSGKDIASGGTIAVLSGIATLVAAIVVRNHARLLTGVLLGEVAMLSVVIGLIARDSATVKLTQNCGFFESDVSAATHHVRFAYTVLGLAIVLLVTQALRGLRVAPEQIEGHPVDPSAAS